MDESNTCQSNDVAVLIKRFHRLTKRNKRQSNDSAPIPHFYWLREAITRVKYGRSVDNRD
jgi:hypothetical protein